MSKRKADVNDIVFEIDSEDVDSSSEEDNKTAKNKEDMTKPKNKRSNSKLSNENGTMEIVNVESSGDEVCEVIPCSTDTTTQNGGKTVSNPQNIVETRELCLNNTDSNVHNELSEQNKLDNLKSSVDNSPSSNSSLNVVGCENRHPLITIKFRDNKMAKNYKKKIKDFMIQLINIHEDQDSANLGSDTDLELDIWPEDFNEEDAIDEDNVQDKVKDDSLFFVDTIPNDNMSYDIPQYHQVSIF